MILPYLFTWTTHTEESTTLLEATRLQEALLYTAPHYTYMCNIVTEFYLYSIVYIYLINSRLDVATSVRHHFRTTTLSITTITTMVCIGRSRGGVPSACPPMGPNSFIFTYIFTEKCPHQRSTPPSNRCMPPLREILDPPLVWCRRTAISNLYSKNNPKYHPV